MDLKQYKSDLIQWTTIISIVVTVFVLGRCSKVCQSNVITDTKVKHDTEYVVTNQEPIVITKYKPKIVYKSDTVIITKPFTIIVDTIIKKDTVKARYNFPENIFDLAVLKKPDSTMIQTITITKEIIKERPWWEASAYTLGGALIGFVLGKTIK